MNMENFYADEKRKIVRATLFDKEAEEIAGSFVGRDRSNRLLGVGRTQLRRLYDEVKRLEQNLDGSKETWEKNLPYIKMIKSKLNYNIVRASEKSSDKRDVYKKLSEFITKGINLVNDEEDYRVFSSLFEAVYGFYYEKSQQFERGN